tara:strand:- start:2141 stop:3343 length:1203 start_codon:yes stop_codon:yes gene_type:complete
MINRSRRKNSKYHDRKSSWGDYDRSGSVKTDESVIGLSQNRYKQTKLPLSIIGKKPKPELQFILNEDFSTSWSLNKPTSDFIFLFQFKWNDLRQTVNLSCNRNIIDDLKNIKLINRPKEIIFSKDVVWEAILKSHLQKCIRRGYLDLALSTTNLLFDLCPIKLLRRLPIIMIEDVCLNTHLDSYVWLMIYYSDIIPKININQHELVVLSTNVRNFLLSGVEHLCLEQNKDSIKYNENYDQELINLKLNYKNQINKNNLLKCNSIFGLQLRKLYGGMIGDQNMLDQFTLSWRNKFNNSNNENLIKTPSIKEYNPNDIIKLDYSNFITDAVDFHPCPWILDRIKSEYEWLTIQSIKETIWHASSCTNFRNNYIPSKAYFDTFKLIQPKLKRIVQKILSKYLH